MIEIFCQNIASEIGGVEPGRIGELIKNLNEGEYLAHGIKKYTSLTSVERDGILPLTPECGKASCWNTGKEIFGGGDGTGLSTLNATFFNWAFSSSNEEVVMAIVITRPAWIHHDRPVIFRPDAELTVPFPVLPDDFHLLKVVMDRNFSPIRIAEQHMFRLLEKAGKNCLEPGASTTLHVPSFIAIST